MTEKEFQAAINVSIDSYQSRMNMIEPIFKPEYEEFFDRDKYDEFYKCGFCTMLDQDCQSCPFGFTYGICTKSSSLFGRYTDDLLPDMDLGDDTLSDEEIKLHKNACHIMINALEVLKKEGIRSKFLTLILDGEPYVIIHVTSRSEDILISDIQLHLYTNELTFGNKNYPVSQIRCRTSTSKEMLMFTERVISYLKNSWD